VFTVKSNQGKNQKKDHLTIISITSAIFWYLIRKMSNSTIKINFLAMLDSMFNLARSASRVCDIADRK